MRNIFFMTLLLMAALTGAGSAAETYQVLAVPAADHVTILYRSLPVTVGLAHLAVPDDAEAKSSCQRELTSLVSGRKVEVLYLEGFGVDADGAARVQLIVDHGNVNEALVAKGLAKFQPGNKPQPVFEEPIRKADAKAQQNKAGMWSADRLENKTASSAVISTKPMASVTAKTSVTATVETASRPSGPFCSELDNKYYYASDDHAVANVNPQRLIFYPDEAAAQRAGKLSKAKPDNFPTDGSEATADTIFAKGKEIYAEAIAAGNTQKRDDMYEQAFVVLSKAMQVYSALVEKSPEDQALGEKLRACMQLRYGSVKQRRFH